MIVYFDNHSVCINMEYCIRDATLLLLGVKHADFKDGWPLVSQQSGRASGGVQLENAATSILVPEQEVFIVAKTKGVVQLLTFIHRLVMCEKQHDSKECFKKTASCVHDYSLYSFVVTVCDMIDLL